MPSDPNPVVEWPGEDDRVGPWGAERVMRWLASEGLYCQARWLPTHFPRFAGGLTYFTLDTGVLRRSLRLAGVDVPDNGSRTHRALDDVRDHLTEWRTMAALIAP